MPRAARSIAVEPPALVQRIDPWVAAFCAWLAVLPLPLGSNRTWALALTLPPGCLLAMLLVWRDRGRHRVPRLRAPLPWLAGFLVLLAAQLALSTSGGGTVDAFVTTRYVTIAAACTLAAWMVLRIARSGTTLEQLMMGVVLCGLLQAAVVFVLLAGAGPVPVGDALLGSGTPSGTFVNRNHLAAYVNLCLAAGLGLLAGRLRAPESQLSVRQRLRDLLALLLGDRARLRGLLILLVIVLILTRSRMGNASFVVGLLAATAMLAATDARRRRGLLWLVAGVLVVDGLLIGAWVGVDKVTERLALTPLTRQVPQTEISGANAPTPGHAEESVEERAHVAREALPLILEQPLTGWGGGTFRIAFMPLSPAGLLWDHAHNDWVEIAVDTGLVGLALLAGFGASALLAAASVLAKRQHPVARGAAFAATMGLVALGLHGTVDFSLQIPAVAVMATVLATLPFAAAALPSRKPSGQRVEAMRIGRADRAVSTVRTVGVLFVAGWTAITALRLGAGAELAQSALERLVQVDAGGPSGAAAVANIEADLRDAADWTPEYATPHHGLALLRIKLADRARRAAEANETDEDAPRRAATEYARALVHLVDAVRRSPASGFLHADLALVLHRSGRSGPALDDALVHAHALAPTEPDVLARVLEAGLSSWLALSAAARDAVSAAASDAWMLDPVRSRSDIAGLPHREEWCAAEAPILPAALCAGLLEPARGSAGNSRPSVTPVTALPSPAWFGRL